MQKRLEEYTDDVRQYICKLNGFDCAAILTDTKTFLYCIPGVDDQNPSRVQYKPTVIRPIHNPIREPCNPLHSCRRFSRQMIHEVLYKEMTGFQRV